MPIVDESLIQTFESLVASDPPKGRQKEQVVQDFLEQHTEFIPTPNRLNHHLHFKSIVSKFPLATEITTDYIYISKSSANWEVTLVELESPDKDLFTADTLRTVATAAFNAALSQVRDWKQLLDEHRQEVIRKLEPLLQPPQMRSNLIQFNFQLVIGRSANKNLTDSRKRHFLRLAQETQINIITYDQLIDYYRNDEKYKKNVLRLVRTQYEFKSMTAGPGHMLSYMSPGQLLLSQDEFALLTSEGYDMDAWRAGKLLSVNGKHTISQAGAGFFGSKPPTARGA